MSLVYYVGDNPAPLRGAEVSNALIELLAVTLWGTLDFLVIDMPPGIGDAVLDIVRLVKRIEFLIVTTSSLLAFETVKKQVNLLCDLKMPVIGVVENMKMDQASGVRVETKKIGLKYISAIPFDLRVEDAIGNPNRLLKTKFGKNIHKIAMNAILTEQGKR
jgi:ATP-binding protein involved in chromosome partitioning